MNIHAQLNAQLARVNSLTQKLDTKIKDLSKTKLSIEEKAERALTYYILRATLERTKTNILISLSALEGISA